MHDVYIYEGKGQDFDGLGLVGALMPSACTHDETAGGNSEVTLEHPFDEYGKWSFLQKGRILKCWVPVRETPLLKMEPEETTTTTQTITRRVYKVSTNGGRLRLRKKPNTSAKILARYNPGTQVVKLADAGTSNGHKWYKVSIVKTGNVGYMAETYLQYVRSYTETIESEFGGSNGTTEIADEAGEANWTVRPQLFEIYRKEVSDDGVVIHARHISYKLLKNITTYEPSGAVTLQTALDGILNGCMAEHDLKAYTNIAETRDGIAWKRINPIKAMLDEEEGAAAKWNAQLVRDNWDLFFLKRAGRQRGMKIEYGKNLVGVDYSEDISDAATRIIPVGQKKDGTDLLLPEKYIDSEHIDDYNEPMLYVLECSDCKVGKDLSTSKAYEKMRAAAKEALENGCDAPTVSLSVDFLSLGDSAEYAQYREMDKLFLYDEIEIVTRRGYADVKAQVTSLSWDCLNDRALEIGVGSIKASLSGSKLTSWQIPIGINGSKLSYGSVGAAQMGADVVSARHMQSDSISTDALQAKSVTAEKIAADSVTADAIQAGSVTAEKIAAGAVEADKIQAEAVTAEKIAAKAVTAGKLDAGAVTAEKIQANAVTSEKIKAGAVKADHIDAGSVTAEKIQAGSITADRLKAYIITADSGLIANGAIGTAQIADGSITSAKVVSLNADVITAGTLSAERLILVGEDGVIYKINAASAGLSASELSKDQYKNYINGTVIVAKSVTAAQIAAQTITGNEIAANAIKAANIDVVELFASEATIAQINAMDISGNEYLKLAVKDAVDGIEVGGRNFAADTNRGATNWGWTMKNGDKTITEVVENGVRCCKLLRGSAEHSGWSIILYQGLLPKALEEGTQYTLTVDVKASVNTTIGFLALATNSSTENMVDSITTIANTLTANEWVKCEWRLTTLASFSSITIGWQSINFSMYNSQPGVSYTFRNLKLEKGSIATDWSPAPEDAADAVFVDSSYSKVEINKNKVRIVSTQMEVAVPSEDGEDDVMRVDADGVHAEVVEADEIISDSVVHTQGDASYAPADAGALAEILEELSGKYLTGKVSIDCKNITSGTFEISGLSGSGELCLTAGSTTESATMNGVTVSNCTCPVYFYTLTFSTAGTGAVIDNSERVYFSNCAFNAGVGIQLGVNWRARARMNTCGGTCTVLAKLMYNSELDLSGSKPTGTLDLQSGSQVYNATSDPTFTAPSSGEVPTTQVATVSLSPTSTSTSGHSGLGSKLYQGRYSSSQSFRKGIMLFTLPTDLSSADNIESATLTIKRIAGVGGGGSVTAQIRCYDQTGTLYASKSVQNGQTVSIDVTSAVKAMKTNSYTGLMLYNPDTTTVGSKTYTTGYARFAGKGESGAPVLKVSYRK